ncbi:hypothetical protein IMZ29_19345 [Achromobacter sp. GG226]|uniref:hypothetical protein n=1 Tax=Verticiella alkaliphila TaxID=2779529 RepID=UPI001C0C0EBA|nr:hypothetical protein [Verticiella sp. GG226]MBU4612620.1 hypothetical protein [Verticiella sp. GG226]
MSPIPIILVLGGPEPLRLDVLRQVLALAGPADTLMLADADVGAALNHPLFAPVRAGGVSSSGMQSVCACCVPQRGLATALREATWRFARGGVRQFSRVIVDSGEGGPAAVLRTLLTEAAVTARYRLAQVIAASDPGEAPGVVDAATASVWAVADVLAIPVHADLATQHRLRHMVPTARVCTADQVPLDVGGEAAPARAWLADAHTPDPF